jgi:flagellar biosynthetic protein FliR
MRIDEEALGVFLVFCRIGACLMIVPGLSTARVPARVRLLLAVMLALVVAPLVEPAAAVKAARVTGLVAGIIGECVIGALLGLASRLLLEAIEFAATAISSSIGLSGLAGSFEDREPQPALASLVTLLASVLLMSMDLPQHLIVAIVHSYASLPQAVLPETGAMLRFGVDTLSAAFVSGLQLAAPFLVYGVVANLLFAILGRLVPQLPSFFVSGPFLAIGEMGPVLAGMLRASLPHF